MVDAGCAVMEERLVTSLLHDLDARAAEQDTGPGS
jgi:hypothetical protein